MRLIKGSKVEVLVNTSRLEVEWHGAQITSGNGHTYNVKYDHSSSNDKALSRRVPRKAIRPCPPAMKNIEGLKVNDAVEVWNDGCWKKATVLKYMTGELYLVALHGSCTELKVQEIHMRMCQSWENGQWIIIPKVPAKSRVMKFSRNLIPNNYKVMPDVQQANNVCSLGLDDSCLHVPSPSTLKRPCSHGSSRNEDYPRKKRAGVIMGESKRFKAVSTAPLMEKVDAIAYPQNNMGEKYMHYSFTNSTYQLYGIGKKNPCNDKITVEQDYSCSNLSSVGSCSVISGSANEFFGDTLAGPFQDDADSLRSNPEFPDVEDVDRFSGDMLAANPCQSDDNTICSDADSLDVEDADVGCTIIPKEIVAEKIHRASVGGLHALLPMAKYDARCA
ncbi:uncharacterized protein LOC131660606 isoform X3 [Vicia villosa]|uniref:uncharacterized protein LOC131660606 isoform X3 n=1 Tax=Vicia villosa TaxID=3911 RepID=UPI00273B6C0A|nr:uncharacterized protein LOC131660606 isoform X3 [Vicia villosa]